jgi:hypothetical protein
MSETHPVRVKPWCKFYLSILCVTNPKAFERCQGRHNAALSRSSGSTIRKSAGVTVCRAFWFSFLLVVVSAGIGCGLGISIRRLYTPGNRQLAEALQIIGTFSLIWATLFVRGWEIQTIGGVTLAERVNQWIYRTLYCFGTALLACSMALT